MQTLLRHILPFASFLLVGYLCVFSLKAQPNLKDFDGAEGHLQRSTLEQADPHSDLESAYVMHNYKQHHKILPHNHHSKKYRSVKITILDMHPVAEVVTEKLVIHFPPDILHTPSFPRCYDYLYFKEINPPPPKAC